jgi:hypothetical protein
LRFTPTVVIAAIVIAVIGIVLFNLLMGGPTVEQSPPESVTGPTISSADDLNPTSMPYKNAKMSLEGSTFQVEMHSETDGHDFAIELSRDGEPFDREAYQAFPNQFSLVKAAGEECDPPIPLLNFPMKVGEHWTWQGTTSASGDDLTADAAVTTSQKTTFIGTLPVSSVMVDVMLTIHGSKPIKRELKFYFAKGKGLFRREFGDNSVREPVD